LNRNKLPIDGIRAPLWLDDPFEEVYFFLPAYNKYLPCIIFTTKPGKLA
jgi:hypothetical protein